ncbi:TPA: Blp family class II bacteriocin [Bacillus cereus]|uniref:Blp family class II bacteriocin n=1 Tax=unclassified Bacillus (in: firmicutes) TaxID=185979 RepID=UPI0030FAD54F|nr:Blp family class II bacteriocin [Bacillus cereus]
MESIINNTSCEELNEVEIYGINGGGWRDVAAGAAQGAFTGGIAGAVTGNPLGIGAGMLGGAIVGAINEW